MIFGHIDRPDSYQGLGLSPAIIDVLREMRRMKLGYMPDERINTRGKELRLLRHSLTPRDDTLIVSHVRKARIHLCCGGKETIDTWPSLDMLDPHERYDDLGDHMYYRERSQYLEVFSRLIMLPGSFVIFLGNEAYRANVRDVVFGGDIVVKVVAQIPMELLLFDPRPQTVSAS